MSICVALLGDSWSSGWTRGTTTTSSLPVTLLLSLFVVFLFTLCYGFVIKKKKNKAPLPPGPRGLPIVGSLPFLGPNLHTEFAKLAKTYGPIFKVQLGSRLCIVLSSPSLAKEIHKEHDIIFSNRDAPASSHFLSYGGISMGWSTYGANWRMLRKICVTELLSNKRLEGLSGLRHREVREMVKQIHSSGGVAVDIGVTLLNTMFHVVSSMLWGSTLDKKDRDVVLLELGKVANEMSDVLGRIINISDLFPVLGRFDLQGLRRKGEEIGLWLDRIFSMAIDRKNINAKSSNNTSEEANDFLKVLLQLEDEGEHSTNFTITHVKALLLDMISAGTGTTATTTQWAMAELMAHPEIMRKLVEEIDQVVGMKEVVKESHLPKLKYLDAVVKESMRLHPSAPLLLPKLPSESCIVDGYLIPKGTKVFVNAWAIHRDANNWENPSQFKPERFLNYDGGSGDISGGKHANYNFIPFGFGRRICVGMPLAERMVPFLLASLLHSFTWKLPDGDVLDLSETFGIELQKTVPLVLVPTPRLPQPSLYD